MSTIDAQRVWLERIATSKIVGFSVLDENGTLVQCIDDDPDLRSALMEYQTQRIRELENGLCAETTHVPAEPVTYAVRGSAANDYYTADGSGGQAGADAAFANAMSDFARRVTTPFNRADATFPHE